MKHGEVVPDCDGADRASWRLRRCLPSRGLGIYEFPVTVLLGRFERAGGRSRCAKHRVRTSALPCTSAES